MAATERYLWKKKNNTKMQKLKNESFASDGPPSDTMIRRNLDCYEVEGDLNQEVGETKTFGVISLAILNSRVI